MKPNSTQVRFCLKVQFVGHIEEYCNVVFLEHVMDFVYALFHSISHSKTNIFGVNVSLTQFACHYKWA